MHTRFDNPIHVTKSFLPPFEEYTELISGIWESHWLTNNGALHQELEKGLTEYLNTPNVSLYVNGHLALDTAIKSLQLTGEVITTPFTFVSTAHAIEMNGLTPVFCDINENDFTIDVDKIETLITEKTSAILPVHVYGIPCDVERIQQLADKYNLKVIYDAAHAFGVEVKGKSVAEFGDISMFSFHATKMYHSIEGGALSFKDESLKNRLEKLKNFGITGPETCEYIALNAKMNEFQAAMGILNLKYVESCRNKRQILDKHYREVLSHVEGLRLSEIPEPINYNYAYFPVIVDTSFGVTRDELYTELCKYNIYPRKYFYPLITDYEVYRNRYDSSDTPVAKEISNKILCLPLDTTLEADKINQISEIILQIHKQSVGEVIT